METCHGILIPQLRIRRPAMSPEPAATSTVPRSPLWAILDELRAANVRATPLNVLARATDLGMSDQAISIIVDELAAERGLDEVAA